MNEPEARQTERVGARPGEVFGQRLRDVRRAHGVTQTELAARMTSGGRPMSREALNRIENGSRGISLDEAVALAHLLQVSFAHMLTPPDGAFVGATDQVGFDGEAVRNFLIYGDAALVTNRGRRVRASRQLERVIEAQAQALVDARRGNDSAGLQAASDAIVDAALLHRMRRHKFRDDTGAIPDADKPSAQRDPLCCPLSLQPSTLELENGESVEVLYCPNHGTYFNRHLIPQQYGGLADN